MLIPAMGLNISCTLRTGIPQKNEPIHKNVSNILEWYYIRYYM